MIDICVFVIVTVFNDEHDIGTYTIKAVDDPRTLNKILYIKPLKNICSLNEVVCIWEKKIGKSLEKSYVPEEQLLKLIQGMRLILRAKFMAFLFSCIYFVALFSWLFQSRHFQ